MNALGLDTERAARHVAASIVWGDGIDRIRHDHERDVAALALTGTGPRAAELLGRASDELWTVAEFVRLVVDRVAGADRLEVPVLDVGALLADARRRVELARPGRERAGEAYAHREWLRTGDRSDIRSLFEDRHGSDAARVLWQLDGPEADAYWTSLTDTERRDVLLAHPEVVALRVLAHSPTALTRAEVDSIAAGNTFPVATTTTEATFDLDVGVRVIELSIGAGLSAILTRMSDGRVEMTLLADVAAGLGTEFDVPHLASVSAAGGLAREVEQRFAFADEASAAAALDTLRRAAQEDASFGELIRDLGGGAWNVLVSTPNPMFGGLIPAALLGGALPRLPTYDLTPDTVAQLRELYETNGLGTTQRVGAFAEATADFSADLHLVEAALDASLDMRLLAYDTAGGPLAPDGARSGVMWAKRIEADADGFVGGLLDPLVDGAGPDGGGHAGVDLDVVIDIAQPEQGETFAEITLSGAAAAGSAVRLFDLEVADATLVDAGVDSATVVVKVPVDPATAVDLAMLAQALARGRLPSRPLPHVGRAAEVDITAATGVTTGGDGGFDVGVVSGSVATAMSTSTTTLALHRRPGGPLYARRDVDDAVARARPPHGAP